MTPDAPLRQSVWESAHGPTKPLPEGTSHFARQMSGVRLAPGWVPLPQSPPETIAKAEGAKVRVREAERGSGAPPTPPPRTGRTGRGASRRDERSHPACPGAPRAVRGRRASVERRGPGVNAFPTATFPWSVDAFPLRPVGGRCLHGCSHARPAASPTGAAAAGVPGCLALAQVHDEQAGATALLLPRHLLASTPHLWLRGPSLGFRG